MKSAMLWLVMLPLVLGGVAATPQAPQQGPRTWESCLPTMCSQTVVAFASYRECRAFAAYRGQGWKMCVPSDKPPTASWETCVPTRCSQSVITFTDLEDCKAYAEDHPGHKKCTRPGGL